MFQRGQGNSYGNEGADTTIYLGRMLNYEGPPYVGRIIREYERQPKMPIESEIRGME